MRKSEHGYQVALPAVTIILIYFKQLNIKIKHLSLDMSTTQVWISFSFYLNLSYTAKNTEASTLLMTPLNKPKRQEKKNASQCSFYSNPRKSYFNIKQTTENKQQLVTFPLHAERRSA